MTQAGALNFDWITPDLAVGGAFPSQAAESLAGDVGIAAVVDLRSEACDDAALLARHGVVLLHLPTEDYCAVAQPALDEGVAFAVARMAQGQRVLIHCREGIGRSVTLALCVLGARGLAPLEAMERIKARRLSASPSPAQYEAWAAWLRRRNVEPPSFDAFAAIAYRHLRSDPAPD